MVLCDKDSPNSYNHTWKYFYPSVGFDFRKCLKCFRIQFIIDKLTFYDPNTNQYVDTKGCHDVKDLVGYNG